jgi:hypothetical protein
MKSLSREADVQTTMKAMEQAPSWFITIPDKKTPWYFLGLDYADGFVHWYDIGGQARRVVCAGGLEGKGFATDNCPICAYVLELYQEAKRLKEEGEDAKSKQVKERANKLHGKIEVQFKTIRGQRTLLKTKTGKEWIADWDTEDEDSTVDIGIISLSEAQFDGLTAMIKGENTSFILDGDGLGIRVLWTAKEKRKNKSGRKYSAVVWSADEAETEMPDMEVEQELLDLDLAENFVIDGEEVDKVFALLSGQEVEEVAEDEAVELEDDSEEVPENADLDDLAKDEDPEVEVAADEVPKGEADFVDDIPPGEDEEPEPVKEEVSRAPQKTTTAKKTTTTRTTTRTAAAVKKPAGVAGKASAVRKSGKARL